MHNKKTPAEKQKFFYFILISIDFIEEVIEEFLRCLVAEDTPRAMVHGVGKIKYILCIVVLNRSAFRDKLPQHSVVTFVGTALP
jgi:hypothetical protein